MELTIKVELDASPALRKLLEAFLPAGHGVVLETIKATTEQPETALETEGSKAEEIKVEAPEAKEAKTEEKPEEITNVKLRDAMEEVRKKFEFTDPNNPDVADPSIHKKLTHQFKEIARDLGADKPTALPQDKREEFIKELENINVDKQGEVSILPF